MAKILINNTEVGEIILPSYEEVVTLIVENTALHRNEFYLIQNGKRLSSTDKNIDTLSDVHDVHCFVRVCGGKGGFGSMLRAIGAQIEKTTNREACRDLSGRRLRDINEEKRLKAWLEKQGEREREAEERKKRKIEKLLTVPKHEFKDEKYEKARSKLTEKVSDAVEKGFKKAQDDEKKSGEESVPKTTMKRKGPIAKITNAKKKKQPALWIGDDISSSDDDSSDCSASVVIEKIVAKPQVKKELQKTTEDLFDDSLEKSNTTIGNLNKAISEVGEEALSNESECARKEEH